MVLGVNVRATLTGSILLYFIVSYLHQLVANKVPEPYMDEIFHVPQAQRYCEHRFNEWDNKITTLPGLYLTSLFTNFIALTSCTVGGLRSLNMILYLATYVTLNMLLSQRSDHQFLVYLQGWRMVLFPLLFSFSYLYYTDVGSTLFVLLAVYYQRSGKLNASALFAAISVLYRQTNIIWAFWVACQVIIDKYEQYSGAAANRSEANKLVQFVRYNLVSVISELRYFVLLAIAFVSFVVWNQGIVVGDRENHVVIHHVTQIFYFTSFCVIMLPFHFLTYVTKLLSSGIRSLSKTIGIVAVASPVVAFIAFKFSHIHKFILSDNRHYIFYIWRRLFKIHITSEIPFHLFALYSPIFVISILFLIDLLKDRKSKLWIVTFFACVCLNVIPLPLIEFRYFLIPYMILSLSIRTDAAEEIGTILFYCGLDAATSYLFFFKSFTGPDGAVSRFMW